MSAGMHRTAHGPSVDNDATPMQGVQSALRGVRLRQRLRTFRDDVSGIAAVEFGLIVPIMLLFFLGTIEMTRAVAIDQRLTQATNMIADLVAREEALTADDVNAIYGIAGEVMRPYDASLLKISLIPVMSSPSDAGDARVYPATTNRPSLNGAAQPAKCQAYSLTNGILGTNESVVVIEASYKYKPMFVGYLMDASDWSHKSFAKPRNGLCVAFDGTCTSSCFS
jgi:Flp pilus assembly pilin Flp